MLDRDVLEVADRWWARDFACDPSELRPDATRVQAHAGRLVESPGIWILVVGPAPLVSLPGRLMDPLADRARGWSRALVSDPAALVAQVRDVPVERIVGPASIGYGTARTLDLTPAAGARRLAEADHPAVARLRDACAAEAWEHGGSDPRAVPTFGCLDTDGALRALAGYRTWGGEIAHLSVVTDPDRRGRGLGTAAVACAARHALDGGLLPQYRTLASNLPSMEVARRLGFEAYGFSVYVRLRPD